MAEQTGKMLELFDSISGTWKSYPIFQGRSAYESYLKLTIDNPKKTEAEWIASLRGKDGIIGVDGKSAYQSYLDTTTDNPKKTEAEWIASFGSGGSGSGKSAYQSYLDTTADNPKKTEAEWVASLEGADGAKGDPGIVKYNDGDPIPEGTLVRIRSTGDPFKLTNDNLANTSVTKEKLDPYLQHKIDSMDVGNSISDALLKTILKMKMRQSGLNLDTNAWSDTLDSIDGINTLLSSNYQFDNANKSIKALPSGIDPYVKLILHAEGANASTVITDSAITPKVVTASGLAQISTASYKYGVASLKCATVNTDYISIPDSDDWYINSPYTIDMWLNMITAPNDSIPIFSQYQDANNFIRIAVVNSGGTYCLAISISVNGENAAYICAAAVITAGTWNHIAVVWTGTVWKIFLNGVQKGSNFTPTVTITNFSAPLNICRSQYGNNTTGGCYIDEYRISKGVARWTENFTPPSAMYDSNYVGAWKFDETSGTLVNPVQGNATGTCTGTTIVDGYVGGKARSFNGSSDKIIFSDKIIPQGAKTIRFKMKQNGLPANDKAILCGSTSLSSGANGDVVRLTTTGHIWYLLGQNSTFIINLQSTKNVCDNNWHDIMITWDGTTNADAVKLYIDSASPETGTATVTQTTVPSINLHVGYDYTTSTSYYSGIIDELEISNIVRPALTMVPSTDATATVIWNAVQSNTVLNKVVVESVAALGGTGSIKYYLSRDGGTTYTECTPDNAVDISSQPSSKNVVMKVVITGNAELFAIAWGDMETSSITGPAPGNVSNISIVPMNTTNTIKWTDPNDVVVDGVTVVKWEGTKLVRKAGSYPTSITDGVVVLDNLARNAYSTTGFTDSGLVNDTTYYYQLFPYSNTKGVNSNVVNRISGTPIVYKIMTVTIDLSNSNPATCCAYADDAFTMTAGSTAWDTFFGHKPCLFKDGAVVCYLNPNDFTKDINGNAVDITSGNAGDIMIEFPRRGLTISTTGNIVTVKMTNNPNDQSFEYNAHVRGTTQKDKFYLGAYKGYSLSSKLRSLSGKTITASQSLDQFRTLAQANGSGYDQSGFYQLVFRQCMYILKYKNLNSQSTIGKGYTKSTNTAAVTTGGTNIYGMDSEIIKASNPTYMTDELHQVKLFGIEDFWGNIWEWIDGIAINSGGYIVTATDGFNSSLTNYSDWGLGVIINSASYISKPRGTTRMGFIINEGNGSATSYFCDGGALSVSSFAIFGGYYADSLMSGIFQSNIAYLASFVSTTVGARLMYL